MATKFTRQEFLLKDLVVNIAAGGGGGSTWLPDPEGETPPTSISPIASVIINLGLIESVRATILEAVRAKKFDDIGRAFMPGDTGGNASIRAAIQDIGTAVVASAAYASLGGGSAGMPDPNCMGTSTETIPTPLTPVVHYGRQAHRVADLPRLRKQLAEVVAYVDKAAAARAPRGAEVAGLRTHLESALKSLPR